MGSYMYSVFTGKRTLLDRLLDPVVDVTPHALRQRIEHGNVYPPERAEQALQHFFREGNLNALRELALRRMSTSVEQDLEEYMHEHDVEEVWPAAEKVLVAIDADPHARHLIRRGWREAQRAKTELVVVFVEPPNWSSEDPKARRAVEETLRYAEDLGAEAIRVAARDVVPALAEVARDVNAATLIVGHHDRGWLSERLRRPLAVRLLPLLGEVDLRVVRLDRTNASDDGERPGAP